MTEPVTFLTAWMQVNNIFDPKDRELVRKAWLVKDKDIALENECLTQENARLREILESTISEVKRIRNGSAYFDGGELSDIAKGIIEKYQQFKEKAKG